MTTRVEWYQAKEAKRGRVAHRAGHWRLGDKFSPCGKTLGRAIPKYDRGFWDTCAACEIEVEKNRKRAEIAKKAEENPDYARELATTVSVMENKPEPNTPELDRMAAVRPSSQAIGEFLEWMLGEKKVELAYYHKHGPNCDGWDRREEKVVFEYECDEPRHGLPGDHDHGMTGCNPRKVFGCDLPCQSMTPFRYTIEGLLAEFFEIDLKKVEEERRAILDSLNKK